MPSSLGKVVLVSLEPGEDARSAKRQHLVAFLPMTIALLGAVVVLVGGLTSEPNQIASRAELDPMTTGSVAADP